MSPSKTPPAAGKVKLVKPKLRGDGMVDLPAPVPVAPMSVTPEAPVPMPATQAGGTLKKADVLARAAARSGVKKAEAKAAMEAVLATLADALRAGDEIVLPPLGKIKVVKSKPVSGGAVALTLRVRLPAAAPGEKPDADAQTGLAEPRDDG